MIDSMGQIKICDKHRKAIAARKFPREGGFSLVELMVVIGILSIIAAIAYPNFIAWKPKYQVGSAARDIYSIFQKAKLEAIKRREYCTVTFDAGANRYDVYVDTDKDLVLDAGEEVLMSVALSDYGPVTFDDSEGGGDGMEFANEGVDGIDDSIAFSALGLPRNLPGVMGSGTIYLKHWSPDRTGNISISTSGSIKIDLKAKY